MTNSNTPIVYEILDQIDEAITRIMYYFDPIRTSADFIANKENEMRLDAISMMLIAIGENLKKLDLHIDLSLLARFPEVDWQGAKGIRDFLSHSYFKMQPEIIFYTCQSDIPRLQIAIQTLKLQFREIP